MLTIIYIKETVIDMAAKKCIQSWAMLVEEQHGDFKKREPRKNTLAQHLDSSVQV